MCPGSPTSVLDPRRMTCRARSARHDPNSVDVWARWPHDRDCRIVVSARPSRDRVAWRPPDRRVGAPAGAKTRSTIRCRPNRRRGHDGPEVLWTARRHDHGGESDRRSRARLDDERCVRRLPPLQRMRRRKSLIDRVGDIGAVHVVGRFPLWATSDVSGRWKRPNLREGSAYVIAGSRRAATARSWRGAVARDLGWSLGDSDRAPQRRATSVSRRRRPRRAKLHNVHVAECR